MKRPGFITSNINGFLNEAVPKLTRFGTSSNIKFLKSNLGFPKKLKERENKAYA
jgi:hypothetical protein